MISDFRGQISDFLAVFGVFLWFLGKSYGVLGIFIANFCFNRFLWFWCEFLGLIL
jgi:hypothetical protein